MRAHDIKSDPYFREALWDVLDVLGREWMSQLKGVTFLIFKPEAIVGRKIELGLGYLERAGFEPLWWTPISFNRYMTREIWRSQVYKSSRAGLAFVDALMGAGSSLCVLLRDRFAGQSEATPRLRSMKGTAPGQAKMFRTALGMDNVLLNFVHTPDTTLHLVRELGVILGKSGRRRLLKHSLLASRNDVARLVRRVHSLNQASPYHSLSRVEACERVRAICARSRNIEHSVRRELEVLLSRALRGERCECRWPSTFTKAAQQGAEVPLWDRIVIGAAITPIETECSFP